MDLTITRILCWRMYAFARGYAKIGISIPKLPKTHQEIWCNTVRGISVWAPAGAIYCDLDFEGALLYAADPHTKQRPESAVGQVQVGYGPAGGRFVSDRFEAIVLTARTKQAPVRTYRVYVFYYRPSEGRRQE